MDDFSVSSLHESRNEWSSRLVTILTPPIIDGYKSILDESIKLCKANNELDKYLMTFQNLISRVPKWNSTIIETERIRICEKSGCNYLEDLVTCVHIIQLKILTAMRVGQKQKKIDINIPKLDDFIHKTYINAARKIYKNVYLFEINIQPLQIQKNHRELEIIVQEAILNTLRESIPVEAILKAYMDETLEEDVVEEIREQIIEEPVKQEHQSTTSGNLTQNDNVQNENNENKNKIQFNDMDYVTSGDGNINTVMAPKNIEHLEELNRIREENRKYQEENHNNTKIRISDQPVVLDNLDIHNIEEPKLDLLPDLLIDDIEVLD